MKFTNLMLTSYPHKIFYARNIHFLVICLIFTVIFSISYHQHQSFAHAQDVNHRNHRRRHGGSRKFRHGSTGIEDTSPRSLRDFSINAKELTVTSLLYNPRSKPSEWIDHIFGAKAIHHFFESFVQKNVKYITADKVFDQNFTREFPGCSFEILGYGALNNDLNPPLASKQRKFGPSVGLGHLDIAGHKLSCGYRAMYENWRSENHYYKYYWPLLFYCPVRDPRKCEQINNKIGTAKGDGFEKFVLSMQLANRQTWTSTFRAKLAQSKNHYALINNIKISGRFWDPKIDITDSAEMKSNPEIGVCTVIPYTSSNAIKRKANGALLREWIRYYNLLGIKMFIYDGGGHNYENIFNDVDGKILGRKPYLPSPLVEYFNYTIRQSIDKKFGNDIKYDNEEQNVLLNDVSKSVDRKIRFMLQGDDKVMTLTHCRFEAKAVYGMKTMIVADFDEFFFCPAALSSSPRDQSAYIRSTLNLLKDGGVDQVLFRQYTLLNKTEVPAICIAEQVALQRSPLECYMSVNYSAGGHSVKSVHLGHTCPLTGYHEACSSSYKSPTHNCICNSISIVDQCMLLHAVSNLQTYIHSYTRRIHIKNVVPEIGRRTKNEILTFLGNSENN